MLRLLIGTDWVSNRAEVLNRITADIRNRRLGQILLVPELISHDTERRLCAAAGDTASRYAEVLSFPQLLRRFSEDEALAPMCGSHPEVIHVTALDRANHPEEFNKGQKKAQQILDSCI